MITPVPIHACAVETALAGTRLAEERLTCLLHAGPALASVIRSLPHQGLPQASLLELEALPLQLDEHNLTVAIHGVCSPQLKRQLEFACKRRIITLPAPATALKQWLAAYAAHADSPQANALESSQAATTLKALAAHCVGARGSDLHLEPSPQGYAIRLRIDGVLRQLDTLSQELGQRCILRLKLMAGLDIGDHRLPQDGAITIDLSRHQRAEFRLATLPTVQGEKITLRLVDSPDLALSLAHLGMSSAQQERFAEALAASRGLILVCGPTSSGKTATLYSALMHIDRRRRHVVSAEHPVEHRLPGVQQVQIEPRIGLDFASVLRAFLRHDPDVMMVGEIRDEESAAITLRAAQTGHLVLATLHATSAAACWTRLDQLGIKAEELASCLRLVIAQRLVPALCTHCRVPAATATAEGKRYAANPTGCAECHEGYLGRVGVFEFAQPPFLPADDDMAALKQDGLAKVHSGLTSLEAVQHVL